MTLILVHDLCVWPGYFCMTSIAFTQSLCLITLMLVHDLSVWSGYLCMTSITFTQSPCLIKRTPVHDLCVWPCYLFMTSVYDSGTCACPLLLSPCSWPPSLRLTCNNSLSITLTWSWPLHGTHVHKLSIELTLVHDLYDTDTCQWCVYYTDSVTYAGLLSLTLTHVHDICLLHQHMLVIC